MDTKYPSKSQTEGGIPADDQDVLPASLQAGHETTDVSLFGLTAFGVSLLFFLAIVLAAVAVVFGGFVWLNNRLNQRLSNTEPAASTVAQATPAYAGPLMQVKPEEDLRWMRDHNAVDLQSYGWIDRPAGIVRLPISRAMDLLVQRGIPAVSPGETMETLQTRRAQPQVTGQVLQP